MGMCDLGHPAGPFHRTQKLQGFAPQALPLAEYLERWRVVLEVRGRSLRPLGRVCGAACEGCSEASLAVAQVEEHLEDRPVPRRRHPGQARPWDAA